MKDREEFPIISVIMPCYNSERYINEAIESVLNQSYPRIELIIIDDGSTDQTKKLISSYGKKITLLEKDHIGPPPPRNSGIKESKGEFIAFLDSDDYWREDFLLKMYEGIIGNDAALAYSGWQNIDKSRHIGQPYIPPDYEVGDKREYFLQSASPWPIHSVLIRKSALKEVGGFRNYWTYCEDYDLWLRLGITRKIIRVPEVMAFYRHHKDTKDTDRKAIDAEITRQIKINFINNHYELFKDVSKRKQKEYIERHFLLCGYECYWKRNLISSQKIFRSALKARYWEVKDLKYLLTAMLPKWLYIWLILKSDSRE